MKIETCLVKNYLPVDKLKFYPDNPRTIDPDRLEDMKSSIKEKGFYEPILVWSKDNIILSGNHRVKAVRQLIKAGHSFDSVAGENQLPVVYEDCDEATAFSILVETNNHYARWIEEKLKKALADVAPITQKTMGFSTEEIDTMIRDASEKVEPVKIEDFEEESVDILMIPPKLEGKLRSQLERFAPDHWDKVVSLLEGEEIVN